MGQLDWYRHMKRISEVRSLKIDIQTYKKEIEGKIQKKMNIVAPK